MGMPGMQGTGTGAPGTMMPGASGMPGMTGGQSGTPSMPGMATGGTGAMMPGMTGSTASQAAPTPAAAPAVTTAAIKINPVEKSRPDPFAPFNVSIKQVSFKANQARLKEKLSLLKARIDFPIPRIFAAGEKKKVASQPYEPPQPARRMAGILLNSRIFAILETNGKYEIVQPGDVLADRLATVERVERDRVILRTTSAKKRQIVVRMAAGNRQYNEQMNRGTSGSNMPGAGGAGLANPMMPGMGGRQMMPGMGGQMPGAGGPMMGPGMGGMGAGMGGMGPGMGPGMEPGGEQPM